jgi:hypothetical protein
MLTVTKELKEDPGHLEWPTGGVVGVGEYHRCLKLVNSRPQDLQPWDFKVLENFGGPDGLRHAREQHQKAIEPVVPQSTTVEPPTPDQRVISQADLVASTRGMRACFNNGRKKARPSAEEREAEKQLSRVPASAQSVMEAAAYVFRLAKELTDALDERLKALESRVPPSNPTTEAGTADASLKGLATRLAALEARPTMSYCGVYDASRTYFKGDCVTDHGSIWHCEAVVSDVRPGEGSRAWTLAVKKGRDGKGVR